MQTLKLRNGRKVREGSRVSFLWGASYVEGKIETLFDNETLDIRFESYGVSRLQKVNPKANNVV